MTHYEVLGVAKDADAETIKKAFRKLAQRYHTDRPTGDKELYQEVQAAYDVLSDAEKRARYDRGEDTTYTRQQQIDLMAQQNLLSLYAQMVETLDVVRAANFDFKSEIIKSIENSLGQLDVALMKLKFKLKKLRAIKRRTKAAEFFFIGYIHEQRRQSILSIKQMRQNRASAERAIEIMQGFDYEFVPSPPNTMRGMSLSDIINLMPSS